MSSLAVIDRLEPALVETRSFLDLLDTIALGDTGPDTVIPLYQGWIRQNGPEHPRTAAAWFNLGTAFSQQLRTSDAIACYEAALAVRPGFSAAAQNLGLLLEAAGQPEAALAMWQAHLQPMAEQTALLNNSGRLAESMGRLAEAEQFLRRSLLLSPEQPDVIQHWVHLRQRLCHWPVLQSDLPGLAQETLRRHAGPLATLALTDDIDAQREVAAAWIARKTSPVRDRLSPPGGYDHMRLRIGYLSSDFCRHPISYLIADLLERHDRGRFEIHGYCSSPEDGSAIRRRILAVFDHVTLVRDLDDAEVARRIRNDEIDVLIDLNGLTAGSRLQVLRHRPAPVQATYLGFIGPVPLPELDHLLCDDFVIPAEDADRYSPAPHVVGRLYQANDSRCEIGAPVTRGELGLPEDRLLLCCFSNHYKITPEMFACWMAILQAAPASVLWLADDGSGSDRALRMHAVAAGIDPTRLIFTARVGPADYLARLSLADLFLDTFPYNAGTVASDAIRMGVPLVTLAGRSFASRMAARLLHAVGAEGGIADSPVEYVRLAQRLATDPEALAAYRANFTPERWRQGPGDIAGFTRGFEQAVFELCENRRRQPTDKSLLIEGWRGINHSFALLNQYQILELLKRPNLTLYHHDLPFAFPHWHASRNQAGFAAEDCDAIATLGSPGERPTDAVLRIVSPYRAPAENDHRRTITFMITELGLGAANFDAAGARLDCFTRGENRIVTSSSWSRDRIVEYGFDAAKVHVVPLGVDPAAFYAVTDDERRSSRVNLGFAEHETVFVNVGAPVWNKGIDLLLQAFAELRARGRKVRLVLKDQRDVYGIGIEPLLQQVAATCPQVLQPETLAAISVIPGNLSRAQLRLLYGTADAYVSPYRAEGFNLPVLEAIACGLKVIVTQGGATDDFCNDDVALRIPAIPGERPDPQGQGIWRFMEPDLAGLIAAMDRIATAASDVLPSFAAASARVVERFSWQRASGELARICLDADARDR